ncbi:RagB/SusD family nutrient uptake outer membrane protein [Dysgonomonas sp. HDW5A]|uniref:RagB/SusD family nutrient uptake outer membrane protein n=1 Tax=unclassified Dysgonomonas TaxID=2630389 RepID=UPI00140E87AB|nr:MULTISPECIES: RagB/SusD family nutrient uptake outer membrane protein [unclassified Dysgonomonas]QIK54439.1 RagB/SusD family nutrient uptake outer membrane protein [Dysgonomonas sp. HDW5B]QIK59846.1 RagB/SusD family nutrient uptake outer membrane protein [Dysgonomonas sp. HDW5A]
MKKIFKIFLGSAFILLLNSCSDFLDRPVLGTENLDTYFQNEEECLKQVAGCYQSIFWDDWWQVSVFYIGTDMATDDMWMGNTTQSQSDWIRMSHYGNPKQDGPLSNYWQYRYKGILRCNIVIAKVPNAPITNENLRKRMIAEAKFLRAFQYFELVKNFGGVPVILEMKLPEEILGINRKSTEETYAQIEQDLKDAITDLPKRSEYSSVNLGRATKGAAMGYLGKIYLYQGKFAEAEKVLKDLIDSNEYDLCTNFKDVWSIENNNSIESLFEVQYSSDISYNLGGRLPVFTGSRDDTGWSWGLPTSNLEKAFMDAGDTERLKWTIVKNGDDVPGDDTPEAKNYLITPDKHKSARINRKFYIPHNLRPTPYDANHNNLNHRLLRYADVLLMYAEAANQNGNDSEARKALKRVRDRVGLSDVTSSGKTLRDAIRLERRLELALEHQRLYDLRRWNDDNGKKALCNIMGENGTFVRYNLYESTDQYEITNQKENSNKGITFREDRDLLFPIPNTEVLLSGGSIEQNPNF